jgi:NADP-dependent 3-hydroxy acid dehydrogenase YdfG
MTGSAEEPIPAAAAIAAGAPSYPPGHELLADRVVVVTAAAGTGIGQATARRCLDEGASVLLSDAHVRRLGETGEELAALFGDRVAAVPCDVTDEAQVQGLVDAAVQRFGRIDVMVNNAGLMPSSPLERLKIDDWDRMIDVNIKGVLYGIAAALPHMQERKSGHIVNVSSVAGHRVRAGTAVYSATKHAVRVLTEGLRQEVKPYNIRTTIVSPGAVATELVDSITEPDVQAGVKAFYEIAIPADAFARAVAYAVGQPDDVDINEILFRPTKQEY